jgi:hypothetical protein
MGAMMMIRRITGTATIPLPILRMVVYPMEKFRMLVNSGKRE